MLRTVTMRLRPLLPLVLLLALGCSAPSWTPSPLPPQAQAVAPTDARVDPFAPKSLADIANSAKAAEASETASLQQKIARFVPVTFAVAMDGLPQSERDTLVKLIEASRLIQEIYERQVFADNPRVAARLAADTSELGKLRHAYFRIMRSPWDRLDNAPFAVERTRPPGAGFYPDGLTAEALDAYLAANPTEKEKLLGLFTVVERAGDKLTAVPYSKAYAAFLVPAAAKLREAAKLTKNRSLARFLESRAAAFGSDDYYASDKDWMDLDAAVEVTIGPYETYEDELKGQKAAFESFVTITDPAASKDLARFKKLLGEMQAHLPVEAPMKPKRGLESPVRVGDLVFSAGDARRGIMTTAFNLPNDERVRKEKGAKKVLLRNVLDAKFTRIMKPIGEALLVPSQQKFLSSAAFFNEVLFHELSHTLGPAQSLRGAQHVDVTVALEELHSAVEEAKADVMGAYNVLFMVQKRELPASMREELLVTYFAGLFRSVRFGVDAHGRGAAMQLNRFVEEGAAAFDAVTGRFTVDFDKLEASIAKLTRDLCVIEYRGEKSAAKALLDRYGVVSEIIAKAQAATAHVPVDLFPTYPLAGE